MWTNRPAPPVNIPEALLSVVEMVKDKATLAGLVKAAQDIAQANKMTEEEAAALVIAQDTVKEAQAAAKKLAAERAAQDAREAEHKLALEDMARRELLLGTSNTVLSKGQKQLGDSMHAVAMREKKCSDRELEVARREKDIAARETAVKARESLAARRAEKAYQASQMLTEATQEGATSGVLG